MVKCIYNIDGISYHWSQIVKIQNLFLNMDYSLSPPTPHPAPTLDLHLVPQSFPNSVPPPIAPGIPHLALLPAPPPSPSPTLPPACTTAFPPASPPNHTSSYQFHW